VIQNRLRTYEHSPQQFPKSRAGGSFMSWNGTAPSDILLLLFLVAPTCKIRHPWNISFRFCFLILYTVGRTPWRRDKTVPITHCELVVNYSALPNTNRLNTKRTSMPWVGYEPTIPVFERAKTVHALDGTDTIFFFCACCSHLEHKAFEKRFVSLYFLNLRE
jgi:hypothetical protein